MSENAITTSALALKNICQKPFRSWCLVLIIALFSATLFGGSVLTHNMSSGIQNMANRLGADILIVPYGYEKQMEVALLRGEPSSFYLKSELVDKIRQIEGVAAVSPQLFISSLDSGCCSSKVQLIGYDPASDFLIKPWMQQKLDQPLKDNEVVVGSRILYEVGDPVVFYDTPFTLAAKMDSTGMGFDTSVFMTTAAAQQLLQKAELLTGEVASMQQYTSSLFIRVEPNQSPKDVVNRIMQVYAAEYQLDFMLTKGLISNISNWLQTFANIVLGLSGLFWLLAIFVIFILFSSSLNERKREISLLRILGTSRRWLIRMILLESIYLCLFAAVLGIAVAALLVYSFSLLICSNLNIPCETIPLFTSLLYAFGVFVVTLLIGPLAAIYSAMALTRFDVYQTLREGE